MELRVIYGRAGSGKSEKCITEMVDYLKSPLKKSAFLIVPEQFMLNAERRLLKSGDCPGLMGDEVLSFRRLAFRALKDAGLRTKPEIDGISDILLAVKTVLAISDRFVFYKNTEWTAGMVAGLLNQIKEFERYLVTPEDLRKLAEDGDTDRQPGFREKLRDLALFYETYREELTKNNSDSSDDAALLVETLKKERLFEGAHIWIDEFHGFTGQERAIIRELVQQAETVTVCLSKGEKNEPVFESAERTFSCLRKIADEVKCPFNAIYCGKNKRHEGNKYLAFLEKNYFAYPYEQVEDVPDGLFIHRCETPFDEVTELAEEIKKSIREKKCTYSDISVLVSDPETYGNIAEAVFEKNRIPYFLDRKKEIKDHPYARILRLFTDCVAVGWNTETLLDIIKTGIYSSDDDGADYLELYFRKTNVTGKRAWKKRINKEIFSEMNQNGKGLAYEGAENLRKTLCGDTEKFERIFSESNNLGEICRKVYDFTLETGIKDKLDAKNDEIYESGEILEAGDFARCVNAVNLILDSVYNILGDVNFVETEEKEKAELVNFVLECCFSQSKIGYVPKTYECVQIGTKERSRSHETKVVYILGANEGLLPKGIGGYGIISDSERIYMEQKNLETAGDDRFMAVSEQFQIYTVLSLPKNELHVSYADTGMDGSKTEPSQVVDRIQSLFVNVPVLHRSQADSEGNYKFLTEGVIFEEGKTDEMFEKNGCVEASFSSVSAYESCPFAYYLGRKLGLVQEDTFLIDSQKYGTVMHDVLYRAFEKALEEKGDSLAKGLTYEECMEYIEPIADEECLHEFGKTTDHGELSNKLKYIIRRFKEGAAACMSESLKFGVPKGLEQFVGGEKSAFEPICKEFQCEDGDNVSLKLRGIIDRFDIAESEKGKILTVIDYKRNDSDTETAKHNVQLKIYADILKNKYEKENTSFEGSRMVNVFYDTKKKAPFREYNQEETEKNSGKFESSMKNYALGMHEKNFTAKPAEGDRSFCSLCAFSEICRAKRKKR